jgi:hypothetical protein
MNQLKVFTVKEANQVLPQVVPLLQELRLKREEILNLEVEIDALELVNGKAGEKNSSPAVNHKVEEYTKAVNRFYAIIDLVQQMGCLIKDVEMGLIDFYSLYKGKVVYLCWKLGEEEITHWHEIGSGFGHRQPIEQPQD